MSTSYDPIVEGDEFEPEPALEAEPLDEFEPVDDELPPDDDTYEPTDEERARTKGWVPLEEFKGEPRLWRDAAEFLRHGYEDPAVLRENLRKLESKSVRQERQLAEARGEISELKGQLGELLTIAKRGDQSAYEQRREALAQRRAEAVDSGDRPTFDQVEAEMQRLEKERTTAPAEPPPPQQPKFHPAILEFIDANPWWKNDMELQRAMVAHYGIVQDTRKDLDIDGQLALAKRRLMADFPAKFPRSPDMATPPARAGEPQRRPAASAVGRPSSAAGAPVRQRREPSGWDRIADAKDRQEAQAAFEAAKRYDPAFTEAEYLTLYFNPKAGERGHVDPLDLRAQRKRT